jgi:chorismate synthase
VAGAVAKQMLPEIKINAYVSSVGPIFLENLPRFRLFKNRK